MSDTDDLRERYAAIFRHAPDTERPGDKTPGEIADLILVVRDEELERLRAELASLTESRVFWRKFAAKLEAERDERQDERDNYLDRLHKAEGAYSRLDAQKRDLEGVRDRLKARGEEAEATVGRLRAVIEDVQRCQENADPSERMRCGMCCNDHFADLADALHARKAAGGES